VDGKAKGVDGWSPAELRSLPRSYSQGLAELLNLIEKEKKWPEGLNPIIALIPKEGPKSEGQLRPIAILPYIYRVWMAIRKCRIKQWALKLNDGKFSSPESLVWEIAARSELSRIKGTCFIAAYIDCSKCYELVNHKVAANAAVKTGCNSMIVSLSFGMYKKDRLIQVSNTDLVPANGGILAGCGFAVHYLKGTIKVDVKDDDRGLRNFVDDMVLFREEDSEIEAVNGIISDLGHTKGKLKAIGQRLNDGKEQIVVPNASTAKLFHNMMPEYKGKAGQAVLDLGITHRTPNRAN
jgi:hypothetical protein